MSLETTPTPLSNRYKGILVDGLHISSEADGISLTNTEAFNLLEYLYQHRDLLYAATQQKPAEEHME